MRKTAKIIVITAILDATQTNRAIASLTRANAPRNCAITTEKNRGETESPKPTKRKRMPPALSQPQLMERAHAP